MMRDLNKLTAGFLCAAIILSLTACGSSSAAAPDSDNAAPQVAFPAALAAGVEGASAFDDVPADADYAQAVAWCKEKGIMNGVSDASFDPDGTLTRAMLVTALYRSEGEPAVSGAPAFTDAQTDTWYSDAVVWANESGLVQGYGNGLFGVNDPVSVEQLEVILGRYTGSGAEWVGDPAKAHPATRAQVAVALYDNLKVDAPAPSVDCYGSPAPEQAAKIDPGSREYQTVSIDNKEDDPVDNKINVTFNGHTYTATLEENSTVDAFVALIRENDGSLTISASDYGGWEKVGSLGQDLPRSDAQTTTDPGDFVLYSGNQIVLFYGSNSWSYTRLGRLDGDLSSLQADLGSGDVEITYSLAQ